MKRFIAIIINIFCLLSVAAKDNPPSLGVDIVDSFNDEFIMDAQVHLLRPDSTLIASYFSDKNGRYSNRKVNLIIDSIPRTGGFLSVTREGYYPAYVPVPKLGPREIIAIIPQIRLTRMPFSKPKELEEVSVEASRVRMIMSGDTITYNTDAFALAQGSMLDGLIDQLPGAELKSNGKIYLNGEFVSELLVDGNSFFRKDPRMALENIPAYLVKNILVFHRNGGRKGTPREDMPLVMDVKLKKQYQRGWIANAEAGYGTAGRYTGRLFGMLHTGSSRLAIVGNVNNINDESTPSQSGSRYEDRQAAGRTETRLGGVDYVWNSRFREWRINANMMAAEKKSLLEESAVSEFYRPGGNIFRYGTKTADSRRFRISSDNRITYSLPRLELKLNPKFLFERVKSGEAETTSTATATTQLNSLDETGMVYIRRWKVGAEFNGMWKLPMRAEQIDFSASVDWTKKNYESDRQRELFFPLLSENHDFSSPWEFVPERTLSATGSVWTTAWWFTDSKIAHLRFDAKYDFKHSNVHSTRDYFLRQPDGTALPSVTDAMQNAGFIPSNSYNYTLNEDSHLLQLDLCNFFQWWYNGDCQPNIRLQADIRYVPGHIVYSQVQRTYSARRKPFYVDPTVGFDVSGIGWITYRYYATLPGLRNLLDVTDAANPLFIFMGNSELKTTRTHEIKMKLYDLFPKGPSLEVTYNKYDNMIAQSADYNMTTGVTTYKPVNVDGNWDLSAKLSTPYCFRDMGKWQPDFELRALYQNSVDLIGLDFSTVRNLNLGGKAKLTYKIKDGMEIAANGNADWRKVTSPMEGFIPISAIDFDYGIIFRAVKLPWDISFTTDLMMHSRRGYNDRRLNTNDLVWNARLAKSIMHGNLTFALDGFDILGQLSNVRLTINSQGRTETRYNTLPRYAMLHVIYRLNINPNKKQNR